MSAIPAIHVGLKQLGIMEDDARDIYEQVTGQRSLRAMKPHQHEAVLGELRRLGFAKKKDQTELAGDYAPKLRALWLSAWNLGIVRDQRDSALLSFLKRQTGIEHTRFLYYQDDARKVIEALKAWMANKAGVDFSIIPSKSYPGKMPAHINDPRCRVAMAQVRILQARGVLDPQAAPRQLISLLIGHDDLDDVTSKEWVSFQKKLGTKIRKVNDV
ncbi:regulatory protein GemA [uncultured Cohaesibacter sp.]|uniref:regulatory protein GemA n=1 Tax=uncultured Cohaesibacter sp. TaxID=1002546 RepID=UPI0029C79FF0|nr:regulatory protein GemA [uncultured Cohaesibacter sp.]